MSKALAQTDAAVIIKLKRVRDTCANDDAADARQMKASHLPDCSTRSRDFARFVERLVLRDQRRRAGRWYFGDRAGGRCCVKARGKGRRWRAVQAQRARSLRGKLLDICAVGLGVGLFRKIFASADSSDNAVDAAI